MYVDDILQTLGIAYNVTGVTTTRAVVVFLAKPVSRADRDDLLDTELNRDTDYQQNGP